MSRLALVVEDEPALADPVAWALEDAGFHVYCAPDGDSALVLLQHHRFDVLVTDIRMPGETDGWVLAKKARQQQPGIAVVYVSGFSPEADKVPGGRFLAKPFRPEELVSAVHSVL